MPTKKGLQQTQSAHEASTKHGIYRFRDQGEDGLLPDKISRYQELKGQFDTEPGRLEFRKELAVHLATMLELGFYDLRNLAESGKSIWEAPPIARMGTYLNSLVRLLDGWPKEDGGAKNIIDVLRGDQDATD